MAQRIVERTKNVLNNSGKHVIVFVRRPVKVFTSTIEQLLFQLISLVTTNCGYSEHLGMLI